MMNFVFKMIDFVSKFKMMNFVFRSLGHLDWMRDLVPYDSNVRAMVRVALSAVYIHAGD